MKIFIVTIAVLLLSISAMAAPFTNWNAGYQVTIPDDWHHVPYSTANIFLKIQNIDPADFDYEAVLALKTEKPFYEEPYIFLVSEQFGEPSKAKIDSIIKSVELEYKNRINRAKIDLANAVFGLDQPVYDAEQGLIITKTRITSEFTDKYHLDVKRFYKKGMAYFLCYAPKEIYNDAQKQFLQIISTFDTDIKESDKGSEKPNIVDLSERESEAGKNGSSSEEASGGTMTILLIIGALVLVVGGITIFIKR